MVRSPLFSQGLFRELILQERFGQEYLELGVLGFPLLQALLNSGGSRDVDWILKKRALPAFVLIVTPIKTQMLLLGPCL